MEDPYSYLTATPLVFTHKGSTALSQEHYSGSFREVRSGNKDVSRKIHILSLFIGSDSLVTIGKNELFSK